MKDSNVRWIGKMPSDWMITKLGSHFKCRNVKVDDISYPPLSVTKMGILPQMDSVAKSDANDNRKQVLSGDFVINSRSDRKQSCGVSELTGSVSLINTVLYQPNQDYDNGYVSFLLKNYGFAEEFYRWGHGIVADLWTTRWQEMKDIDLPFPPMNVQKKIAYELQNKIKNIDSLVLNETKQIEKLEEYKKAVITRAVTKGLDSNAKMKDSGVKWIGDIPEYWRVCRLKNVVTIENGKEIGKDGGDVPVYGSGGIFKYTDRPIFVGESLLMGRKGTIDKPMLVDGPFWTVDTMFYTSRIEGINAKFLFYACCGLINFDFYKSGSVLPSMTQTELNNIWITRPNKDEQQLIVDYLDGVCGTIQKIISLKKNKIDKLQQYKKSLIYEYVTGKKAVEA